MEQHFLVSRAKIAELISAARLTTETRVLEIGAGEGTITEQIVHVSQHVTVVELDDALADGLRKRFSDGTVTVLHCDALEVLDSDPEHHYDVLFSSLPSSLTEAVLAHLLAARTPYRCAIVCARGGDDWSHLLYDFSVAEVCLLEGGDFQPMQPFDSVALLIQPLSRELFRAGLIADTQYCLEPDAVYKNGTGYVWTCAAQRQRKLRLGRAETRHYAHSLEIMQRCTAELAALPASANLRCCLHLGDVVDRKAQKSGTAAQCLEAVLSLARAVPGGDFHYVLGNNDVSCMRREEWLRDVVPACAKEGTGGGSHCPTAQALYYDFCPHPGFRFVVLDGMDESKLGFVRGQPSDEGPMSAATKEGNDRACAFLESHMTPWSDNVNDDDHKYKDGNGMIGQEQLAWLTALLTRSDAAGEKVFIFCHLPIHPGCCRIDGLLWNNLDVLRLLQSSTSVQAFISGHDHLGGYIVDDAGIHHLTPPAPLETPLGGDAFGQLAMHEGYFRLLWRGQPPPDFTLGPLGWPLPGTRLPYRAPRPAFPTDQAVSAHDAGAKEGDVVAEKAEVAGEARRAGLSVLSAALLLMAVLALLVGPAEGLRCSGLPARRRPYGYSSSSPFSSSSSSSATLRASLYDPTFTGPSPDWFSPEMLAHGAHLVASFHARTGRELVPLALLRADPVEAARALFLLTDTVVVSHGTQAGLKDGPVLNYGNTAALRRWGASWEQLTSMPSRYTAEAMEREERASFMRRVSQDGVVLDYSGVRVTLSGERFRIKGACVWNINVPAGAGGAGSAGGKEGGEGVYIGQAAAFSQWDELSDDVLVTDRLLRL